MMMAERPEWANACLVRHESIDKWDGKQWKLTGEDSTQYFPSLEEAAEEFIRQYPNYPTPCKSSGMWHPDPCHRVQSNRNYGKEICLYYYDERRPNGWHSPSMDMHGRFYRGAILRSTRLNTVPGYGYMERRKPKGDAQLPPGTARGDRTYSIPDLVNIGGAVVDQAEINRVRNATGELPTHLTYFDNSGSCLYLKEIIWGDEPEIIAGIAR